MWLKEIHSPIKQSSSPVCSQLSARVSRAARAKAKREVDIKAKDSENG